MLATTRRTFRNDRCRPGFAAAGYDGSRRETRLAAFTGGSYNAETRTAEIVISSGQRVRRWYGWEELAISEQAVDLSRVALGQVRLLDHHNGNERGAVLGVLTSARIEGGRLVGTVRLDETEDALEAAGQISRGVLTGISAGYRILEWAQIAGGMDAEEVWRAERWELLEVSLVSIPADPLAGVRSDVAPATSPAAPASPPPDAPALARGNVMTERSAQQDAPAQPRRRLSPPLIPLRFCAPSAPRAAEFRILPAQTIFRPRSPPRHC